MIFIKVMLFLIFAVLIGILITLSGGNVSDSLVQEIARSIEVIVVNPFFIGFVWFVALYNLARVIYVIYKNNKKTV